MKLGFLTGAESGEEGGRGNRLLLAAVLEYRPGLDWF